MVLADGLCMLLRSTTTAMAMAALVKAEHGSLGATTTPHDRAGRRCARYCQLLEAPGRRHQLLLVADGLCRAP